MPRYNVFAEVANRIQINQQQYLAQNPEVVKEIEEQKKLAEQME